MNNNELIKINLNEKGVEELIPVYETTEGNKVVNGRELWECLCVKQDFSHWIKNQIEAIDAKDNKDYSKIWTNIDDAFKDVVDSDNINVNQMVRNGYVKEYILTLNIAKEICMIAGVAPRASQELKNKSKQYRKYLIKVEEMFKEIVSVLTEEQKLQLSIFNAKDKHSAIMASAELDRYRQKQITEKDDSIKELSPLAELARKRIDRNGTVSITDVTKTYYFKRGQVTTWAKHKGYIHKIIQEVNKLGEDYFKVVEANGFKTIAILENGIKLIDKNEKEIHTYPTSYKRLK